MKKVLLLTFSTLAIILLSGCGAKGAYFKGFEEPKKNKGLVYVYRPDSFIGGGVYYDIHVTNPQVSDMIAGTLRNGGYVKADVDVGQNEIWGKTEAKESVYIDVKEGETYCVKGGVGIGFFVGRPTLNTVNKLTCTREIYKTQLAE